MITVKGLTKRYANNTAVDHISFEVQKGQIVGFLGPNGAGKTTTMRMLTCFLTPSGGTASVAGFDILEQPFEVKKRIGYLPETPPVYPEMRIVEYLTFVGRLKGLTGSDLRSRVDYSCERCAIADVRNKIIGKLSKGYRQRVGLAQAIIHNPDVLILDEPTAGLDPKQINSSAAPGLLPCPPPAPPSGGCTQHKNIWVCRTVQLNPTVGASEPLQCGSAVSFQYPFQFYLPFTSLNMQKIVLSAQAQSRMEN